MRGRVAALTRWFVTSCARQVEPFRAVLEAETAEWFYLDKDGQQSGPVNGKALAALFEEGEVDGLTMAWHAGLGQAWQPVAEVPLRTPHAFAQFLNMHAVSFPDRCMCN
jgi:hypothetical protein